jgi:hypothetical protein
MGTGVHQISPAALLDRELRCQTGQGLASWAADFGVSMDTLIAVIEGRRADTTGLFEALASTLGVSVSALRSAA